MEKYREGQKELYVDLEKAYDNELKEDLWYCTRKSVGAEKYFMRLRTWAA